LGGFLKKELKLKKIGLPVEKKYTVQDAKKNLKTKQQRIAENLRKLELIQKHSRVVLDDHSTNNIIERAVTRRPIKSQSKKSKDSKTAFTEEDFRRFEEEYLNSED